MALRPLTSSKSTRTQIYLEKDMLRKEDWRSPLIGPLSWEAVLGIGELQIRQWWGRALFWFTQIQRGGK